MSTFETYQVAIGIAGVVAIIFAAILAFVVSQNQVEISDRLLKLQDYVAISVTPGQESTVALWNTGKANVYMWGFDMPNNNIRFNKPRLISPSTVANYWIPAPNLGEISETTGFDFKLYLTDEYDNKWISENGGEATPIKLQKEEKEVSGAIIKVWAHKTYRSDWQL